MKHWLIHLAFLLVIGAIFLSGCVSETNPPALEPINASHSQSSASDADVIQETHSSQVDSGESDIPVSEVRNMPEYLVYFNEGKELTNENQYEKAIAAFNTSIMYNSSFPDAYFWRGMNYYQLGRGYSYEGKELGYYQNAINDFSTVLQNNPSHEDALTLRGWSNYWIGRHFYDRMYNRDSTVFSYFDKGIHDTNRALEINPLNIDALNCRALNSIHRGQGSISNAEFYYNRTLLENGKKDADYSLKLNSNNPWAYFARGIYYLSEFCYPLSDNDFSKAIELDPDEPLFYLWKGLVNQQIDKQIAVIQYNKAIDLNPRYAGAYNNRAAIQSFQQIDTEQQLSGYETAIEIDPSVSKYYQNYAFALWNLKWWDKTAQEEVLRLFDKALELDPTNYQIHGDKAFILIYLNRNHESTQEILLFQQNAKTNEDFEYAQALLHYNGAKPWYFTNL